ncbi:MAG TPA: DUF1223 domain-containing protein [Ideonella sp.]|uniref:DUF1223 domain-containing protein n=1 Tax=Ideonella sp. TaxID=1929293 RepID=UPI002E2F9D75|nr:DUF1223 domain-containing protein [Ideonella sp.]HEX5687754.1 DUF1223 domain-containing protein [Ideonella sp.]
MPRRCFPAARALAALATLTTAQAASPSCTSTDAAAPKLIVELYTSEGCNSCPTADQWLAALPRDGSVLALAFHVDYWDSLGWTDRFADAAYTGRQRHLQASSGARFVYTPQLIVGGRDFPGWRQLPAAALVSSAPALLPADAPSLRLRREGAQLVAEVGAGGGGQLAGYWALLEDGHQSQVAAGENSGRALRHEHVVRRYQPVAAWPASQAQQWRWTMPSVSAGHAARAVFVLTDAGGGRPLRAQQLTLANAPGC